jgi:hypothetical protein
VKDTHNLRFKFRKFDGEDGTARMEDEIAAQRQQVYVAAQGLAHAALDAVAFMGFTKDLAGGEADARGCLAGRGVVGGGWRLRGQKPGHGRGLPLAAGRIGALIVGVLLEARAG